MIVISIEEQRLYHRRSTGVWYAYPISSASKGVGNQRGSGKTPLGRHRIWAKIGEDMPANTLFIARRPVGYLREGQRVTPKLPWKKMEKPKDCIVGRILWLSGMDRGINRGGRVDTRKRFIYIHGTDDEANLGRPASHGCIRMRSRDILELSRHAKVGERVFIRPVAALFLQGKVRARRVPRQELRAKPGR